MANLSSRSIFIVAFALAIAPVVFAAPPALQTVSVTDQVLGGAVLMIRMQSALVIDGSLNSAVAKELGEKQKKAFYKDMVMERSVETLRIEYQDRNIANPRVATKSVIDRYEEITKTLTIK